MLTSSTSTIMERLTARYQKRQRTSPRDIGIILNNVIEENKAEGSKEQQQQDNNSAEKNQNQEEQQRHLSLSTEVFI